MAQIGGENTYEFLNLPHTARVTALGSNLITVMDDDVALGYHNPSLLNASMHQQLSFSNNFYMAGINQGYAGYGHFLKKPKLALHTGIQFIDYGTFDMTNESGQILGNFSAAEYAWAVGVGYQYTERISLGTNIKTIFSQFESYNSVGLAADLATTYQDTSKNLTIAFVIKNMGTQLATYNGQRERIPFDVQLGISKQLKYLPFRYSIILHDFYRWDIRYDDPNDQPTESAFGEPVVQQGAVGVAVDNFFRHVIINGELLLGKAQNFRLRVGYNHQRRAELQVDNTVSFAGFSFGAGIKVNRFKLDYGRGVYHLAGGTNHLTISTNFQEFKKKNR